MALWVNLLTNIKIRKLPRILRAFLVWGVPFLSAFAISLHYRYANSNQICSRSFLPLFLQISPPTNPFLANVRFPWHEKIKKCWWRERTSNLSLHSERFSGFWGIRSGNFANAKMKPYPSHLQISINIIDERVQQSFIGGWGSRANCTHVEAKMEMGTKKCQMYLVSWEDGMVFWLVRWLGDFAAQKAKPILLFALLASLAWSDLDFRRLREWPEWKRIWEGEEMRKMTGSIWSCSRGSVQKKHPKAQKAFGFLGLLNLKICFVWKSNSLDSERAYNKMATQTVCRS